MINKFLSYALRFISLFLFFNLLGCVSSTSQISKPIVSFPNDDWWSTDKSDLQLTSHSSSMQLLEPYPSGSVRKNLIAVRMAMNKVTPLPFTIGFSDDSQINAFATNGNFSSYIVLTDGFLRQFGADPDVIAGVMGHELAHHQLGHTQPDYGQMRNRIIDFSSQSLGIIASYFIPFSGLLVGNTVKGVGLSYSRDDERKADDVGISLSIKAGYSPCGFYRFAAQMNTLGEGAAMPFLSTHPGNNERMENANRISESQKSISCATNLTIN